jgi:CIC family chloride channel protein
VTEVVALDETLLTALRRIGLRDVPLIPVIDHPDRRQLIGVISRADVLRSYDREVGG